MIPVVWSERDELNAVGERDCWYSAILMALIWGGKVNYPLGIYSADEREALERSDNRPDETGASATDIDVALMRRYGLAAHATTTALLPALLKTKGKAVAVGGELANFPNGHWLRRWDPGFTGGHEVCVLTRGDGNVTWLDPLAPWLFAGDQATVADVLTFARNQGASNVRYVNENEYATTGAPEIPSTPEVHDVIWTIAAGTVTAAKDPTHIFASPDPNAVIGSTLARGAKVRKLGGVTGWRQVVLTLGGKATAAWLRGEDITAETNDMTLTAAMTAQP